MKPTHTNIITRDVLTSALGWNDEDSWHPLGLFDNAFASGGTFNQIATYFISQGMCAYALSLAYRCPASVTRSSWRTRARVVDASVRYPVEREVCGYKLATLCPVEVPGSEWRFRLNYLATRGCRSDFAISCPVGVDGADFDSRLAVAKVRDRNWYNQMHFAVQCPGGVPGDSWEKRKHIVRFNSGFLAKLGSSCPAETPGSTFEDRLSLQRNYSELRHLAIYSPIGIEGATIAKRLDLVDNEVDKKFIQKKYASEG